MIIESATDAQGSDTVALVGNVEYRALADEVVRTEKADGKVIAQEHFQLHERESATFHSDEQAGTATLRVQHRSDASSTDSDAPTWEILAATGLDLRYQERAP